MRHFILFFIVIFVAIACKPKQTIPQIDESFSRTQKISLDYGDSLIYFRVADKNEIEPDLGMKYTWFRRDTIMTTQGQFSGKLLEGEFEVLRQKDRSLIRKGEYKQGLMEGKWIQWYPSGVIIQKAHTYKEGVRNGDFLIQKPDGKMLKKGKYSDGLLEGVCSIYQADTLAYNIRYKKGVPTDTIP